MVIKQIIGTLATTCSVCLQISPMPAIIQGIKEKEVKSLVINYFIAGISQTLFWLVYGIRIKDVFVMTPNITCYILFSFYLNVLIYLKKVYKLFIYTNASFIIAFLIIVKFFPEHACDSIATIISLIWQTTNIETIKLALYKYDSSYINLPLSIVSWLNFGLYWIYSLMIHAYIMFIPNFYGFLVNTLNLFIYFWTKNYISQSNEFIAFLKKFIKPPEIKEENTENNIEKDNNPINEGFVQN